MDLKHTGCKGVDRYASGYGELEGCCLHNKYHIVVYNNTNKMHTCTRPLVKDGCCKAVVGRVDEEKITTLFSLISN